MDNYSNPKVVGATIIGFAMVAGTYVISNFGTPPESTGNVAVAFASAPARVFVPVTDSNDDGVEDWREQFTTAPAIVAEEIDSPTNFIPTTLTEQVGVNLVEGLLKSIVAGPVVKNRERVVADNVERITRAATSDKIFDVKDIIISPDSSDQAVRQYGNTLASILIENSIAMDSTELYLLDQYLTNGDVASLQKLKALTESYQKFRDNTLNTPVPRLFVKEHLDLINVYNAVLVSLEAMTKVEDDPLIPFMRLQRYEDDILGLALSLDNMYNVLVPFARVFEQNDPAALFVTLSSNYQ
jgi:hypothetical protein